MSKVMTVCGEIPVQSLGKTLMHEHLVIGMPGWELDTLEAGPNRRDLIARCVDRIEELKAYGYQSMVDPCPNDLGRDIDFAREVATRTGFNIVAATGFYNETFGGNGYWQMKSLYTSDFVERLAELMIRELTEGTRTGVRPGIIKLATSRGNITAYERKVFEAGARAAIATGVPITTHTEGELGDQQQALLTGFGVSPDRIIIGHCCEALDNDYLDGLLQRGSYVGFDRFGIEAIRSDAARVDSFLRLWRQGAARQIVLSHDCAFCLLGNIMPPSTIDHPRPVHQPLHLEQVIIPQLRDAGVSADDINMILVENPRRYFGTSYAVKH